MKKECGDTACKVPKGEKTQKSKFRDRPERNNQHPAVSGCNGRNLRLAIPIYVLQREEWEGVGDRKSVV